VKSGLKMPVGYTGRWIREHITKNQQVSTSASVALAAIIEYVAQDLLQKCEAAAKQDKKKTIMPVHFNEAIKHPPYNHLLHNAVVSGAPLVMHVPKARKRKASEMN
jgi:histone H2A